MKEGWKLIKGGGGVIHRYSVYEKDGIEIKIHKPPENHISWFWEVKKGDKKWTSSSDFSTGFDTDNIAFDEAVDFVEWFDYFDF